MRHLALLLLLLPVLAGAFTVAQRGSQLLIDGKPTALTFARGCDDPAEVPAYRALGFNTLLVKVDSPGSVVLERIKALTDAADAHGLYVLYELRNGSWIGSNRANIADETYRKKVANFLKAVLPLHEHPRMVGWIVSTADEGQLFTNLGTFTDWLKAKYGTVTKLNDAWSAMMENTQNPIRPQIGTFSGLTEKTAAARVGGNPEVMKKVNADIDAYRREVAAVDGDFQAYLKTRYNNLEALNRELGFEFPSWEAIRLQTILNRETEHPNSAPLATLEVARYRMLQTRSLMDWWAQQVRAADGAHLIFAGAQSSYRTLSSLPRSVNGALTECYPGVTEMDPTGHNPHALDIARHGNRCIVLAGISADTNNSAQFANYLYLAALHGASGLCVQNWTRLRNTPGHTQMLTPALADLAARQLLGRESRARTAIVYSPYLPGFMGGRTGLYGYLASTMYLGSSGLFFTLRNGTVYGQIDYLSPDDLTTQPLSDYGTIILPSVLDLPDFAQLALRAYVDAGGLVVADLGLGTLQANGNQHFLPVLLSDLFGVTITPGIKEARLNLEVYRSHPLFPSLLQGMRTAGLNRGFQITRIAEAVPLMGTDLLFAVVGGRPKVTRPSPRPFTPLPRVSMRGFFVHPFGRGYACFAPFPLYQWWTPGCLLFEEFHRDLFARNAEVSLDRPIDFLPDNAGVAVYQDGSVAVWTKDRLVPEASVPNPARHAYLVPGGQCRLYPDRTTFTFSTPGYHLVEPLPAFVYPTPYPVSVTAMQVAAKSLVFALDTDPDNADQPVKLRFSTGAYAIAPHSRHLVTIVTPTGGSVESYTADGDGWLTLTLPSARCQLTLSAEAADIDVEHPVKPDKREVEVNVVPNAGAAPEPTPGAGVEVEAIP
jgi:hypothetical protein